MAGAEDKKDKNRADDDRRHDVEQEMARTVGLFRALHNLLDVVGWLKASAPFTDMVLDVRISEGFLSSSRQHERGSATKAVVCGGA